MVSSGECADGSASFDEDLGAEASALLLPLSASGRTGSGIGAFGGSCPGRGPEDELAVGSLCGESASSFDFLSIGVGVGEVGVLGSCRFVGCVVGVNGCRSTKSSIRTFRGVRDLLRSSSCESSTCGTSSCVREGDVEVGVGACRGDRVRSCTGGVDGGSGNSTSG